MTLTQPSESRQLPVRLSEIRPQVRLNAARQVANREPGWAAEVLAAALHPSSTVYYVQADAWVRLAEVAA